MIIDSIIQMKSINFLDIIVIIIMAYCLISGYMKGLVRTIFDLFSYIIALAAANKAYPYVSKLLRYENGPYDRVKISIIETLNLSEVIEKNISQGSEKIINTLPFPDFINNKLIEMNNPEIYKLLGVSTLEDYIGGYFANIFINILAGIIVFIVVTVAMKVIIFTMDILCKLPVINKFNKTGGLIVGLFTGALYIWIGLIIYTLFFINPQSGSIDLLKNSIIAIHFYENNLLFKFLLKILTG